MTRTGPAESGIPAMPGQGKATLSISGGVIAELAEDDRSRPAVGASRPVTTVVGPDAGLGRGRDANHASEGSLPAMPGQGKAFFPVVGGGAVELAELDVFRLPVNNDTVSGPIAKVVGGAVRGTDEVVVRSLQDARYGEIGHLVVVPVRVRFKAGAAGFTGDSFSLALAIADKRARLGGGGTAGSILATGVIRAGGQGAVDPVDGFAAKLAAIVAAAGPGDTVVVSRANLEEGGLAARRSWEDMAGRGVRCLAIGRLAEAEALLWPPRDPLLPPRITPGPRRDPVRGRPNAARWQTLKKITTGILIGLSMLAGVLLIVVPDPSIGLKSFEERIDLKSPEELFLYCQKHYYGDGVPKDIPKAVKCYFKPANMGYAKAQYALGYAYHQGEGIQQDYAEALKWYKAAASQGLMDAQYRLGDMYYSGEGVTKSEETAAGWYLKAAEQGYPHPQYIAGWLYEEGRGVAKNEVEAARWYTKAAEQGYDLGEYSLGVMYNDGRGVRKDQRKAWDLFKKAAEKGYVPAWNYVGMYYRDGVVVKRDVDEAARWFWKARLKDDADAKANLQAMCVDGRILGKNEAGLRSTDWKKIQLMLEALGHDPGSAYGVPSCQTREALAAWQRASRLAPIGYLRPIDREALLKAR